MEIEYMLSCIANKRKPKVITPDSTALTIKLAEAEQKSVLENRPVQIR